MNLQKFRKWDEKEVRSVYEKYFRLLKHVAYNILKRQDEAEDVAQEAFLDALKNASSFHGDSFISWLCSITRNKALDRKKKLSRTIHLDEEIEVVSKDESPAELASSSLLLNKIRSNLTSEEYDIFIFRIYYELSFKDIASITSQSVSQVIPKFHRIKKKVKDLIGGYL